MLFIKTIRHVFKALETDFSGKGFPEFVMNEGIVWTLTQKDKYYGWFIVESTFSAICQTG